MNKQNVNQTLTDEVNINTVEYVIGDANRSTQEKYNSNEAENIDANDMHIIITFSMRDKAKDQTQSSTQVIYVSKNNASISSDNNQRLLTSHNCGIYHREAREHAKTGKFENDPKTKHHDSQSATNTTTILNSGISFEVKTDLFKQTDEMTSEINSTNITSQPRQPHQTTKSATHLEIAAHLRSRIIFGTTVNFVFTQSTNHSSSVCVGLTEFIKSFEKAITFFRTPPPPLKVIIFLDPTAALPPVLLLPGSPFLLLLLVLLCSR